MENIDKLNPKESLDIIADAIEKTKENLKYQSFYYLLWGWLVSITALICYGLLNYSDFAQPYLPWAIVMPLGVVATIFYSVKNRRKKPYQTHLDTFLKHLWIVMGIAIFLVVFISIQLNIHPTILTLFLAGIGTLVSGLSMKFKPFILGGITFFGFAVGCLFVDESTILLINAFAIIIGYLIPAYVLKNT